MKKIFLESIKIHDEAQNLSNPGSGLFNAQDIKTYFCENPFFETMFVSLTNILQI